MVLVDESVVLPFAYDFTSELEDDGEEPVAHGAYSNVYRAKISGREVAIKVLRANSSLEVGYVTASMINGIIDIYY